MKDIFKWAIPLTNEEIKDIWNDGILTVDTNVLLDLYRYHLNTRQALLSSLDKFKGRAWISYQVADEFFRNRNGVIVSSKGAFKDAERLIYEVSKAIEDPLRKLKNSRIIPDEVEEELEKAIQLGIHNAKASIEKIKGEHPDYRKNDPVLAKVVSLFKNRVGEPYSNENFAEVLKEAKRRIDNKIPPGFKDSNKDGDKPFGDFVMWRQIMDHVKQTQKPLILVTSEQKEDWWEKAQGETIGPLYELLKEFYIETGQRLLFYSTYRFLEYSDKTAGKAINKDALADIQKVIKQREKPLIRIVSQNSKIGDSNLVYGTVKIELLEPAYMFTCSGRFVPELKNVPELMVKLVSFPLDTPKHLIRIGTGTTFDFNIHMKSTDFKTTLPTGEYTFDYAEKYVINESFDKE